MDPERKDRQPRITVILFLLLIFGTAAATIVKPSSVFSETENRVLAQRPKLEIEAVINGDYETDYEEYLTDQFILRDRWIGLKTAVERGVLKRESKDIYFAGDHYLIEKHTGVFDTPLAKRNLEALSAFTQQYTEQLGSSHISVLIIPNAVDILCDKLPPFAPPGSGRDYLELLKKALPESVFFDAAHILDDHRDEELYYRTDHHWKTLAAFYVYQAWAREKGCACPELSDYERRAVTDSFEGTIQSKLGIRTVKDTIELFLPEHDISCTIHQENLTKNAIYDYAALDGKDKYAVFLGGNEPFLRITTAAGNGRKILVIKDSYANCFIPFMLGEFEELHILDLRYSSQKLSKLIQQEQYTDLLILYNASGFAEDISMTKLTANRQ